MRQVLTCFAAGLAAIAAPPATAAVAASSESGFVSHNEAVVAATTAEVWAAMLKPAGDTSQQMAHGRPPRGEDDASLGGVNPRRGSPRRRR